MRRLWSGMVQGSAGEASTLKALPELCFVIRCAIFVLYQSWEAAHFLYLTEEAVLGLRQQHWSPSRSSLQRHSGLDRVCSPEDSTPLCSAVWKTE